MGKGSYTVTSSRHYRGGTGGAFQETARTYDGYGRLKTSKALAQDGPVSYAYDADDVPLSVTDPRGVVATYGFTNARRWARATRSRLSHSTRIVTGGRCSSWRPATRSTS